MLLKLVLQPLSYACNSVSVNNEGNRVDITVNMPSTNRLSLARLRQNYIHRLMNQARELIENLRDPSHPSPRPDRDRLYQANAYDLDANEESQFKTVYFLLIIDYLSIFKMAVI